MINGYYIEGKKVSIKYNLMTSSKPKVRSFLGLEPSEHFSLQFEVLHNRKLNRRTSLFYLFEKHYFPFHLYNRYFTDHYIDNTRYIELEDEDKVGQEKWHLSDLILLEKNHIFNLLRFTEGWNETDYSFSQFGQIYEKATIFGLDLIETEFMNRVLSPFLSKALGIYTNTYETYLNLLQEKYGLIETYKFFSTIIRNLNPEIHLTFEEDMLPYIETFELIQDFLKPRVSTYSTVTEKGKFLGKGRFVENLVTLPTWVLESYDKKIIALLKEKNVSTFEFTSSIIIEEVNYKMNKIKNEIEILFRT